MSDLTGAEWTYTSRNYSQSELDDRGIDSFEEFNSLPHKGECPMKGCDGHPMKSRSEVVCPECYTLISVVQSFEGLSDQNEADVEGSKGGVSVSKTHLNRVEYGRQVPNEQRDTNSRLKQTGGFQTAYVSHRHPGRDDSYTIDNYDSETGSIPL